MGFFVQLLSGAASQHFNFGTRISSSPIQPLLSYGTWTVASTEHGSGSWSMTGSSGDTPINRSSPVIHRIVECAVAAECANYFKAAGI